MRNEGFRRVLNGAEKFRKVLAAAGCILLVAPIMLTGQTPTGDPLKPVAERYVKLVLAVGQHDGDYVDAFYGPAEWRTEAEASKLPLATIDQQAADLAADFAKTSAAPPVARRGVVGAPPAVPGPAIVGAARQGVDAAGQEDDL